MKIGFIMAYNEADWISYAIDHALKICDRLIICEGSQFTSFPDIPERSTDGTRQIIIDKIGDHEYTTKISLLNSIREYSNYRENQCANFNRALSMCKPGDYFIPLDVDEYYSDKFIERLHILMSPGYDIDYVKAVGSCFGFSFQWQLVFNNTHIWEKDAVFKVTPGFHFIPTHKPSAIGRHRYTSAENSVFHYTWVKPTSRIKIRMQTSGFYPNMPQWFADNWESIELIENKPQIGHSGELFTLKKYTGNHPCALDNHPWRHIEDVRKNNPS